ncbi:MAG: Ig-like domain repeat protein, partial [Methanobrevibacter sp.]|nr:Ig-like domain repeat protein [Methanobrevibacter sp.]
MLRRKNRLMMLISLIFLLILIPTVCAVDNETALLVDETSDNAPVSILDNGSDILKASNDYYFDASVENDGDGSQANPYKYLTADRIKSNANVYLANGVYNLDTSKSIQQVNIYGSDVEKTVINYDGIAFTVSNYLNVKNVTFIGSSITNYKQFTAVNTIFTDGYGSKADSYTNNYGGAIYTASNMENAYVSVDNCTFKNNYAQYGGAIYMGSGVLEVTDSLFYDNYAYNYGGAIACDYASNVTVKKSKFYNSVSQDDAGGSIYIRDSSKFKGEQITVVNSSATFGGAITTLNTDVSLTGLSMSNNSAKYDGGAIYHMYGDFSLFNSNFNNNSATNGGALFIDNSTNSYIRANTFSNNHAENAAGAIFSLFNKYVMPFERYNNYNGNTADFQNDIYYVNELNLTIGNRNYTMYNVKVNPITHLPNKYSLITDGFTTAVKDQQASGNCWAFTAIAVLESCILKASGDNLDLSEENMKNVIELYSDYGWKMDTNEGGYDYMPWGYLASWLGPISEADDYFDDHSTLSPVINSVMHVQNIKFLNRASYTDNDEIKRAILQYGAVGTGIYFDSYYLNSDKYAYYNWVSSAGNHAVTIVGWDDTFSKSNFKWASNIEGDGAWIVRNSWGPNWGNNGYFYVSYYDATFARPNVENSAYTIVLNDTMKYDKNYQYDVAGMTDYFLNSSSQVWYKNRFTVTSDEYLAAVSTYFEKMSDWMASVYVNGELRDVLSGKTSPGYYTFNLNKLISLDAGDVFEVVFNITTDGVAGFPISEELSLNKLTYSPGISYVSWDGENWKDLYNLPWSYATHTYKSQVACIKAFTITSPIITQTDLNVDFLEGQPLNITATVKDEYGNLLRYGNVTFNVNGADQIVAVNNGIANLLYDLDAKVFTIKATFNAEGYNQSSIISYYSIPKIPIELRLKVVQNFNDVDVLVRANRTINENVIVNINGNETLLRLINGTNTLYLKNLTNGFYQLAVILMDESDYIAEAATDEFTINMHRTYILSDNITVTDEGSFIYNITMLDENDGPVAGREIAFAINNVTYKNVTDENGQSLISIALNKGLYDVNIAFDGDNNYFKTNSSNEIKVKGKLWINLDVVLYNNNAILNIYASKRINETFTVLINDRPQSVAGKDGIATLKLFGMTDGDYDVRVLLDEDEYEFNDANSQFTIQYGKSANITSHVESVGDDAQINITVENATGYVKVIVDGVSDILELNNSQAVYVVKDIAPGNHSLVVIYEGDDFKQSIKSEIFSIAKKESQISLIIDGPIGGVSTITANVTPNVTGFVSVNVNGTEYLINLSKTNKLSLVFDGAGEYSVVATYFGDEKYNSSKSEEYKIMIHDKSVVNVTVQMPDVIRVGSDVEINVSSDVPVEFKVYVDGELSEIVNGKIQLTAFKAGLHTVQIVSDENEDYYGVNKTVQFNVVKNDANIFIDIPQTVFVGENITINPLTESDGKLNITINGQVINSSYVIPFKGTFVIEVKSAETEMYNPAVNSTTFTSQKQSSEISLNVTPAKSGEKTKISVEVTDQATGIVIVNVNSTSYSINLENGNELEIVLNKGSYLIEASYVGDEKYESSVSDKLNIGIEDKLAANVKVEIPSDVKVGDRIIINVSADTTSDLIVAINGVPQEIVSGNGILGLSLENLLRAIENGKIVYTVPSAGVYNVTVTAMENGEYLGESVTEIFEVTKKDASLDITPIVDAKIGDTLTISVVNETDGAITVKVNGEEVSGAYKIIKDGTYTITAVSAASDAYNAGFATYTFTVEEEPVEPKQEANATISVPGDVKAGEDASVDVAIPNATGNVSVIVDGKETVVALVNGSASVPLENVTSGDHSVVVIYSGDETHAPTHSASSFSVAEEAIVQPIATEFVDIVVFNDSSVSATLVDESGNAIANATVSYTVGGVSGSAVTDVNGLFTIKGESGVLVTMIYAGDDKYLATNTTIKFDNAAPAVKENTSILAEDFTQYACDFYEGERGENFTFQLVDANGNPVANRTIYIGYNGVTLNRTTDAKGFASVQINLKNAGLYTFVIVFLGDEDYNASMAV